MNYDFNERLNFSLGQRGNRDAEIIKHALENCIDVRKTDQETDRRGIDYIATLEGGAEVGIDVKARDKGISRYWNGGEEDLVLEIWSVYPDKMNKGKLGWTLSDKTNVDYILYTFDETDSTKFFFLPYQLLRNAFKRNGRKWINEYGTKFSHSASWSTQVIFVPVSVVLHAINDEMQGLMKGSDKN